MRLPSLLHSALIPALLSSLLAASACRSAPSSTTRPAAAFITVDGTYQTGGDCAHGSPENPTCIQTLELSAGGKGSFVGDDIVEPATWQRTADTITVAVSGRTMTLRAQPDGTLVDGYGSVWRRAPQRMH
jgi:hypothetical protein